jgi:hypothetical protein
MVTRFYFIFTDTEALVAGLQFVNRVREIFLPWKISSRREANSKFFPSPSLCFLVIHRHALPFLLWFRRACSSQRPNHSRTCSPQGLIPPRTLLRQLTSRGTCILSRNVSDVFSLTPSLPFSMVLMFQTDTSGHRCRVSSTL